MFRGFCTVTFYADDMTAAEAWYTEVFGLAPYFRREAADAVAYLEWRVGDLEAEFGIVAGAYRPDGDSVDPGGAIVFWAVDDVDRSLERVLGLGARLHQAPIERGPGFVTASVIDPFGNILGVMYNEHYLEQVERLTPRDEE